MSSEQLSFTFRTVSIKSYPDNSINICQYETSQNKLCCSPKLLSYLKAALKASTYIAFDHYDFNSDTLFTGVTRSYQRTCLPITYMQQRNRSDQSISFLVNIWANVTDSMLRHEGNLNHATKSSTNRCGEKQNLPYELTEEPSSVYRGWLTFDQCL